MPRGHKKDEQATQAAGFEDEHSFVGLGGRLYLKGDDWKAQQSRVIIRDDYICQLCRRRIDPEYEIIDVHHIVFRSDGGSEDMDNLITVHRRCHDLQHPEKKTQFSKTGAL